MSYGYTVAAPMVLEENPLPYRDFKPEEKELPEIKAAEVGVLRKKNTLAKQLPAMPASSIGDLSFTNYNQVKAYEDMQALGVGQADRKYAERMNRAQAKAEEQAVSAYVEGASKNYNSRQAYKRSEYGKKVDRGAVNRIAQGIGALHVLYPIR